MPGVFQAMRSRWPLTGVALLFSVLLAASVFSGWRVCAGHFGYPLDDTYIHMAMAKNFALHQVWGITRYGFTSSTSSPLFTLLLAGCYAFTGVREITPLLLNGICAFFLLIWCDFVLRKSFGRSPMGANARAVVLGLLVLAIPLPTLVHVGMEHVLHTLLTLVFVYLCCTSLAANRNPAPRTFLYLAALTPLLATARYEAVFLIGAAGVLFLWRGLPKVTLVLAIAAIAPLAAYGWVSVMHGWYPIPSSLLLKANVPTAHAAGMFGSFSETLFVNLTQGFHVTALTLLALSLLYFTHRQQGSIWTYSQVGLILFVASASLHLCFARVGWFFRYESYLIALGIMTCAVAFHELELITRRSRVALIYVPLALFVAPISYRLVHAAYRTPQAISDIYCQQYQMGLFARDNFAGKAIVVADIGAVSFLSDAQVLDLVGLGSREALHARLTKTYSTDWVDRWTRSEHAVAALTAVSPLPASWTLLATWTIPDNYISGADHVSIYAVDPAMETPIADMLAHFWRRIPRRVIQHSSITLDAVTSPARRMGESLLSRVELH